ncbi:hypothetical protein [uncultured Ruegeria sp.]|uniref:hypothetical protein n=1 Tax=uncultured Ruegeria sp. TaxID=259304 RepID=UPI00260DBC13|nr:hypothetical protein [uncultured Ruegeria sp.]
MAQQSAQKRPDDDVASKIAALHAEIERLKQAHTLELRKLEIASYKAEMELATRCRHMPRSSESGSTEQAGPRKTFFFRADGRPKKFLRLFLFAPSGQPRSLCKRIIFKKNGKPRSQYVTWMKSTKYQSLPKAYRWSR